jgi:hypothetical protein
VRCSLVIVLLFGCAGTDASRKRPEVPTPSATAEAGSAGTDAAAVEWTALNHFVAAGIDRMRPCYRRELASDQALERKMAIAIYVTPTGKVADMTLMDAYETGEPERKSTLLNDTIARCLGQEVMGWMFPPTTWEGQVQLVHPPIFIAYFSAKPTDKQLRSEAHEKRKEAVRQVIRARNPEYKACYDAYLERGGPTDRDIRVRTSIRIRNEGSVEAVTVLDLDPPAVEMRFRDCILDVVRTLQFGKLEGEGIMIVEYPFVFTPGQ